MDQSDPAIRFNSLGVCNYCVDYMASENDRRVTREGRGWLIYLIKKVGQNQQYDSLIGLSGGVDSSLALHYMIEQGLRPFTYTVDNGWNTPESDENILRMVEKLKVPFYRYTIDIPKFRELQWAFLQAGLKNVEIPTDHLLWATSYEMASKYKIKSIISGGNVATESIMPKSWGYQARDLVHIKGVYRVMTKKKLVGLPMLSLPQYLYHRFIKKIQVINLLDYYDYHREGAKQLLSSIYSWKDYGEKHCESVFTQWFQNFYLPTYFKIDKRRAHYSSLINSGQMTRQQALEKLQEPLEYQPIIDLKGEIPIKDYTDYPNSERWWNLLTAIYGHFKRRKRFLHQR